MVTPLEMFDMELKSVEDQNVNIDTLFIDLLPIVVDKREIDCWNV
jgi:hypothetical protein